MKCKGFVHKYGDHVNTDAILPARELNHTEPAHLAAHCMEDIDAAFTQRVRPGDIMIGGLNFGCGSSREHAPIAIKAAGISCVIAVNFARIFFRNAINIGLPVMECAEAVNAAETGDELEADLNSGIIYNLTKGFSYTATPFPAFVRDIIAMGGLVRYTQAQLAGKGK